MIEKWEKDIKASFKGWDFSYIHGRLTEARPPWNYMELAEGFIRESKSVLDQATGGGEVFSTFAPFPGKAVAIEGYKPNVPVARKRLKKVGVNVLYADESKKLPFKDEEFDLVLNRHGAMNAKEISRVLSKGGIFLTQQVEGRNLEDLKNFFNAKLKYKSNTLEKRRKELVDAGFKIKKTISWEGKIVFKDVGALIYFLKAIPWIVEGFSVKKHIDYLKRLDKMKKIQFTNRRFLIIAEKK